MKALRLLKAAAALFDDPANELSTGAKVQDGFQGGGEWMRRALGVVRGCTPPARDVSFSWPGYCKYAAAFLGAVGASGIGFFFGMPGWGLALLFVAGFYAVEVQCLFLFPLVIDGRKYPWRASLRMTRKIGTLSAMAVVLPLAAVMLTGGLFGRGFVRCWCLGCLAVVLWYEEEALSQGRIPVRIEKVSGPVPMRILWMSDLHLARRNAVSRSATFCRTALRVNPDIIILGGDLVDDAGALPVLRRALKILCRIASTHVLPGNHDVWVGLDSVRRAVAATGATWHDEPGFAMRWDGSEQAVTGVASPERSAESLLFVHDPKLLDGLIAGWQVAFAGHLHGGQCVLWRNGEREYPGAWFSRWNGPRFQTPNGPVLVSRGAADTLPLRWNCPREVILCEIS